MPADSRAITGLKRYNVGVTLVRFWVGLDYHQCRRLSVTSATTRIHLWCDMIVSRWPLILVCGLVFSNLSAQTNNPVLPANTAKLIRVQISNGYGLGGSSSTTIEPFFMVNESEGMFKSKHFHRKTKSAITKRDWDNLQKAVDARALASAPQGVCAAISDGPCDSLEVEFSDKTKIGLSYNSPPPAAVSTILHQIKLIRQKPFRSGIPFEPLTDSLDSSAAAKLPLPETQPQYPSVPTNKAVEAAVAALIENMLNRTTERQAFVELEGLGCPAVPAIIDRMDDRRTLPDPHIWLANKS